METLDSVKSLLTPGQFRLFLSGLVWLTVADVFLAKMVCQCKSHQQEGRLKFCRFMLFKKQTLNIFIFQPLTCEDFLLFSISNRQLSRRKTEASLREEASDTYVCHISFLSNLMDSRRHLDRHTCRHSYTWAHTHLQGERESFCVVFHVMIGSADEER